VYTVVAAHPFDWFGHSVNPKSLITRVDAIETVNSSSFPFIAIYSNMTGEPEKEIVREMRRRYKVDEETVKKDYQETIFVVNTFAKTPDVCPVSYLGVEKIAPFEKGLSAPYRMDLALTYRCNK
jgi:hypothetical protein